MLRSGHPAFQTDDGSYLDKLALDDVSVSHGGVYICIATNTAGYSYREANVNVISGKTRLLTHEYSIHLGTHRVRCCDDNVTADRRVSNLLAIQPYYFQTAPSWEMISNHDFQSFFRSPWLTLETKHITTERDFTTCVLVIAKMRASDWILKPVIFFSHFSYLRLNNILSLFYWKKITTQGLVDIKYARSSSMRLLWSWS